MRRLDPNKLSVCHLPDISPDRLAVPRRYTLTHSDRTGRLFLSIGAGYDTRRTSKLYTRLMRDEVLAELIGDGQSLEFHVYCHVSGGLVVGPAAWRYRIFRAELPLALEAMRWGDRALFQEHPHLDHTPVHVHMTSPSKAFNRVEHWGAIADYR